jgi:hypothetical protein
MPAPPKSVRHKPPPGSPPDGLPPSMQRAVEKAAEDAVTRRDLFGEKQSGATKQVQFAP